MKIHSYIYIFILFNTHLVFSQEVPHLNIWSRVSLSQTLNEKWTIEGEFQHRRQNYFYNNNNLLNEKLLSSFRTWLHYKYKEDLSFAISPFAYYWHNSIIIDEKDKIKPQTQEIRWSAAVDLKHELLKSFELIDRTCVEYRDFQQTSEDFIRMRNRLGLRYHFNEKWNVTFFDEIFINLMKAKSTNIFDHERFSLLFNYKPRKNIRIEVGYIFITRYIKNTADVIDENNFLLHLYYTLPHPLLNSHHLHQHHS